MALKTFESGISNGKSRGHSRRKHLRRGAFRPTVFQSNLGNVSRVATSVAEAGSGGDGSRAATAASFPSFMTPVSNHRYQNEALDVRHAGDGAYASVASSTSKQAVHGHLHGAGGSPAGGVNLRDLQFLEASSYMQHENLLALSGMPKRMSLTSKIYPTVFTLDSWRGNDPGASPGNPRARQHGDSGPGSARHMGAASQVDEPFDNVKHINNFFMADEARLPVYIAAFGSGFFSVLICLCAVLYTKYLFAKVRRVRAGSADKSRISTLPLLDRRPSAEQEGVRSLAETRAMNTGLSRIDDYIRGEVKKWERRVRLAEASAASNEDFKQMAQEFASDAAGDRTESSESVSRDKRLDTMFQNNLRLADGRASSDEDSDSDGNSDGTESGSETDNSEGSSEYTDSDGSSEYTESDSSSESDGETNPLVDNLPARARWRLLLGRPLSAHVRRRARSAGSVALHHAGVGLRHEAVGERGHRGARPQRHGYRRVLSGGDLATLELQPIAPLLAGPLGTRRHALSDGREEPRQPAHHRRRVPPAGRRGEAPEKLPDALLARPHGVHHLEPPAHPAADPRAQAGVRVPAVREHDDAVVVDVPDGPPRSLVRRPYGLRSLPLLRQLLAVGGPRLPPEAVHLQRHPVLEVVGVRDPADENAPARVVAEVDALADLAAAHPDEHTALAPGNQRLVLPQPVLRGARTRGVHVVRRVRVRTPPRLQKHDLLLLDAGVYARPLPRRDGDVHGGVRPEEDQNPPGHRPQKRQQRLAERLGVERVRPVVEVGGKDQRVRVGARDDARVDVPRRHHVLVGELVLEGQLVAPHALLQVRQRRERPRGQQDRPDALVLQPQEGGRGLQAHELHHLGRRPRLHLLLVLEDALLLPAPARDRRLRGLRVPLGVVGHEDHKVLGTRQQLLAEQVLEKYQEAGKGLDVLLNQLGALVVRHVRVREVGHAGGEQQDGVPQRLVYPEAPQLAHVHVLHQKRQNLLPQVHAVRSPDRAHVPYLEPPLPTPVRLLPQHDAVEEGVELLQLHRDPEQRRKVHRVALDPRRRALVVQRALVRRHEPAQRHQVASDVHLPQREARRLLRHRLHVVRLVDDEHRVVQLDVHGVARDGREQVVVGQQRHVRRLVRVPARVEGAAALRLAQQHQLLDVHEVVELDAVVVLVLLVAVVVEAPLALHQPLAEGVERLPRGVSAAGVHAQVVAGPQHHRGEPLGRELVRVGALLDLPYDLLQLAVGARGVHDAHLRRAPPPAPLAVAAQRAPEVRDRGEQRRLARRGRLSELEGRLILEARVPQARQRRADERQRLARPGGRL
ncbi:uncharacterized protein BcabD6B2_07380 [Babesia caballi]|uniref:Uncharacterized protein n=1 Tax=Babesia caballi TaxID=5871 RepID=A0AAV4LMB0_BABCB|nr:hypothetical protein, conserved [Babesia caballi]